jgi:hypothetical protein
MPILVFKAHFGPSGNDLEFGLVFIKSIDNGFGADIGQLIMGGSLGHEKIFYLS